ncbi:hypothetical protein PTI98_009512 [Pleurotus ostreatus]|nr:hypothetical protein PTI98_009512 [Pleurotus ostreatus]
MANLSKDKEALKPNPHPYAIKTTSTALLSRSNSSSQSARPIHNYIPSPSPSPTRSRPSQRQYGYSHGSGHRYSRSLTGESPRPLPVPPSPSPTKQLYTSGHGHSPSFDVDLPANPKLWTPSQLATYLATALRVRSGESLQLPAPVARDIAAFVKTSKITGKEFLRFNEQDLNDYGINKLWSTALFAASRTLRQNVLKGRIWGFGSNDFNGPSSNDTPFGEHAQYDSASSTSSLDIDRSYSDNDFFDTTFQSNAKHPLDDVTPVKRARKGRVSVGKLKNGRVKGMVETFERSGSVDESTGWLGRTRSGSESSVSGSEDPVHPTLRPHQTGTAIYHTQPPQFLPPSHQVSEPLQSDADTYDTATEGGQYDTATEGGDEGGGSGEPSPQAPRFERVAQADEELPMEELLAQIEVEKSSGGVHAWELDGNGTAIITMKHLPTTSETPVERSISSVDSLKGRPLPHPPASGSPVVFLPAAQTLPSQSTGSRQLPALPNSHIHAPKPQHGSLRGLGASWNAVDGDGVSLLTGSVDSLLSTTDDGALEGQNGSFGNSDGWTKAPSEAGSGKASKRIRVSGGSGLSSGSGRVSMSRRSSGQTKRAGISEIFGISKEEDSVVESTEPDGADAPTVDSNEAEEASKRAALEELLLDKSRALEELQERITEKESEAREYAAEKAACAEREQTLQTELADALALVESYKTRLGEAEKRVEALEDAEERRRQSETSVTKDPISAMTRNKSQKPAQTFGAGFNLGLFMNLVPQSVLGRVFRPQTVSPDTPSSSRSPTAVGVGKDDVELGEAQKGFQSATASPSAPGAPSTSSNRWKDWLALSPVPLYSGSGTSDDSSENGEGHPRQFPPWSNPATIRALPPYVFLVGLGVAAVVLRVVLKRVGYRLGLGVGVRR